MLHRWSSVVFRRRRLVLALSGLSLVVAIVAMIAAGGKLSSGGFNNPHSESSKVTDQLATTFGRGRSQIVFIFDAGKPVSDPAVRSEVEAALAPLSNDSRIAQLLTTWNSSNPAYVSKDGKSTYAVALLNVPDDDAGKVLDDTRPQVESLAKAQGLDV